MYFYENVRADYCSQLLSEIKVPSRMSRHKEVWQKKVGVRNKTLDCEVYALHAARSVGTCTVPAAKWALYENALLQSELFAEPKPAERVQEKTRTDSGSSFVVIRRRKGGNFVTNY